MSLNPDIRDRAYEFFIEEAQELLQVLESGLLELKEDRSTSKVHELMRAAHSIKGGAASVELSAIELLAHRLEDFFKALYSDDVDFDAELEGLLLQGYDCLSNPLLEQIESGSYDEETALLSAEPVFAALETRLSDALKNADSYIPSSSDLGVDIVSSIFEVDVAQSLEHLEEIINNPTNYDLAEELQGTLDMFAGFAELFNLPGFSDIIQTAQTALSQNSDRALEIAKVTLADCTVAKDKVLAGDRSSGGEVSSALIELAQAQTLATSEVFADNSTDFSFDESDDNLWGAVDSTNALADDVFGNIEDSEGVEASEDSIDDVFGFVADAEPAIEATQESETSFESAEDIFGAIPNVEPVAELETDNESVEDIFGTIADSEHSTKVETVVASKDSINDVFGTILDEEPVAEAEEESETSFESAEDIFGTIPDAKVEPTTEAESVEDIFGIIPDGEPVAEAEEESEASFESADIFGTIPNAKVEPTTEAETTTESIEDIFGAIPNTEPAIETNDKSDRAENIEDAVQSIENIFDRLPNIETNPESLALPTKEVKGKAKTSQSAKATSGKAKKAAAKMSVKVDLERLERMNNLVGELTINRNSLSLQNEQLQENVSELGLKFSRFREVTQKLREISDRIVLEQRFSSLHNASSSASNKSVNLVRDESTEFDALEMDNYSGLYAAIQDVLEEVVQLEESVDDITIFAKQSDRTIDSQRQMLAQMRDELMWVRMLPLNQILQRFPRTIRDLASKYKKPVDLKLTGTEVLVDKAVLEKLSDPLLHLLRNGFDHGIEEPELRSSQGKAATGTIEIHAYYQGNQTVIEVKDDGKGLDVDRIAQKGIEKGLISAFEVKNATKERLYDLIFEPGFSTASKVSELSGRGVGMNIVRSQIETLKGKISVTSSPGKGSVFTLRLPLTLTIAKLLVCSIGVTSFAVPSDSIEEIIIPTEKQIKISDRQKFLSFNSKLVPIYNLQEILHYNCPVPELDLTSKAFKTIAPPEDWFAPLLLIRRGQELFALEVTSLVSEQELVIKPYGKAISAPPYSYGCTILGDGSLIPAFDGAALISTILGEEIVSIASEASFASDWSSDIKSETSDDLAKVAKEHSGDRTIEPKKITSVKTIMVVDDSTALRRTMALTLEKHGYRVVQRKDGKDALDGFKQNPDIDLIICDVEMPTMNGFEFLGMRRRDSQLSKVPTFMLTSRSGTKHRNLATQLGADGYFTKPYVEQEFIAEVKKILEERNNYKNKTGATATFKKKTILIIDDSSALRRTLALCLESKGYHVLQGRDGIEGLELLRNNLQTNLVICDVEMPNMNGFEFLTTRRTEPNLKQIPVVMLTSRSTDKHRSLATNLGADGYFTKPYIEDKFMRDVDSFIRKYSQ